MFFCGDDTIRHYMQLVQIPGLDELIEENGDESFDLRMQQRLPSQNSQTFEMNIILDDLLDEPCQIITGRKTTPVPGRVCGATNRQD